MDRADGAHAPMIIFRREVDRRSFLRGAAAAGILGMVGVYAWRVQDRADAQADVSADLINLAATMESLLCAACERALETPHLTPEDRRLVEPIFAHESAYVEALAQAVQDYGARPIEKPTFRFPDEQFADRETTMETLAHLMELSIRGWQGQVPSVQDPALIPFVRPIAMAKPRHAAVLAWMCGDPPFPDAIESMIDLQEGLDAIAPYRVAG